MNPASPLPFNVNLIFVIVGGLIVLAMIMGRKNRTTQRSSYGWWIGLGILLFIASGFLGFTQLRVGPVTEIRHSGRSAFQEMKEEIRAGVASARDSIQKGLEEVKKSTETVQQTLETSRSTDNRSRAKRKASSAPLPPAIPSVPLVTVSWVVEVKEKERKQKKEDVENLLLSKAASSVNRWVTERMPLKDAYLDIATPAWLQERGVFPDPIDYQTEEVPRANTSLTDQLLGGTMKVILTPSVQENLIEQGYQQLELIMSNNQFQTQWIVSNVLLGITVFVGILGLVKTLVFRRMTNSPGSQTI